MACSVRKYCIKISPLRVITNLGDKIQLLKYQVYFQTIERLPITRKIATKKQALLASTFASRLSRAALYKPFSINWIHNHLESKAF